MSKRGYKLQKFVKGGKYGQTKWHEGVKSGHNGLKEAKTGGKKM